MKIIDTLLHARWIVPVEAHNIFLEQHAIAVENGRILEILPSQQAEQQYQAKETLHFAEHVLMPGLVNAHTHSAMSLFRGLADDLTLQDWWFNHMSPAEKMWVNEQFVREGTQLAMAEMLLSGTTCFNDNYFYTKTIAETVADTCMRANVGIVTMSLATPETKIPDEALQKGLEAHRTFKNHPLINVCIAPHAPYTVNDETLKKIHVLAKEHSLIIHMHVHETAHEVKTGMAESKKRPLKRIDDLGLLGPHFQAIHMTQVNDEDFAILNRTNTHVVHCPESNLKLASGFCPAHKLIDAGINVALGTDGAASNNDLDMLGEIRTAALAAKGETLNPTALPAATVLRMATLNGARAMGLEHEIGSLKAGKAADIIAIDFSDINTQPIYNPISHLVYATNARQVTDVWVAGKRLVKNRQLTTLDKDAIIANAKNWRDKIAKTNQNNTKKNATATL